MFWSLFWRTCIAEVLWTTFYKYGLWCLFRSLHNLGVYLDRYDLSPVYGLRKLTALIVMAIESSRLWRAFALMRKTMPNIASVVTLTRAVISTRFLQQSEQRRYSEQGHPTMVSCKISVRRSKYCLEFSITWGRLKISKWSFHSCTIFEAYSINSLRFSEVHISPPRLGYFSYKKGNQKFSNSKMWWREASEKSPLS